jgi:hypothetical protein
MRSKWVVMLVVAATAVLFLASTAMGQFLLCLSEPGLKGEKNVKTCSAAGAKFAFVDKNGLVRIPTKEEMDLTMAFNPKIGQLPAFGMQYGGEAPKIPPMPYIGDQ